MNVLVVVDMQNDFVDGALGTKEAEAVVPRVVDRIKDFEGLVLPTRDTHEKDYLQTQEGKKLPVEHCIRGSEGWQICEPVARWLSEAPVDKPSFGSMELARRIKAYADQGRLGSITLIGLCTDICVISNALLLKAAVPEIPVIVDASCCAGVTPASHRNALEAMKMCQIEVINEWE